MATAKIVSLAIRTLSKPIAANLKQQAHQHDSLKRLCIALAQSMHRTEMALRLNLLNSPTARQKEKEKEKEEKEEKIAAAEKDEPPDKGKEKDKDGEKEKEGHHKSSSSSSSSSRSRLSTFFPRFTPARHIRPLNEAKAVQKGAETLSELFLFAVAVALIVGENARANRKRKKQRDATEEHVRQVEGALRVLAERLERDRTEGLGRGGPLGWEALSEEARRRRAEEDEEEEEEEEEEEKEAEEDGRKEGGGGRQYARLKQQAHMARAHDHEELQRLQAAVSLLLRLGLKNGWIQGPEALQLGSVMEGQDAGSGSGAGTSPSASGPPTPPASLESAASPPSSSAYAQDSEPAAATAAAAAAATAPSRAQPPTPMTPQQERSAILEAVALERARQLAREVRSSGSDAGPEARAATGTGTGTGTGDPVRMAEALTLAELMHRAGLQPSEGS